jgi:hypothetical protein
MELLLALLLWTSPAPQPSAWTWESMRAIPGVDATHVEWLEKNARIEDVREVAVLAAELSGPESAQLLGAFARMDTAEYLLEPEVLTALGQRPAAGDAGLVEVVARVLRVRRGIEGFFESRAPGAFAPRFEGRPLVVPGGAVPAGAERVRLTLDPAPARAVLELLARGETRPAEIEKALATPAFQALVTHRSQSFYRLVMRPEVLAANLARAAAWTPVDRLWHAANRHAFLDFADVRANLDAYRLLLDELERQQGDLNAYAQRKLVPYLPPGLVLDRRVTLFFAGGADGWASSGVAGLDVQYFKDRHDRLLDTLVHEAYHVAQASADTTDDEDGTPTAVARAARALFSEGTATFVAPALRLTPEEQAGRVARGVELLRELLDADAKRADEIVNEGVRGSGPFYWLGLEMARAIVDAGGPSALARILPGGARAFIEAYVAAAAGQPKPVLDPALARRLLR